MAVRVEAVAQIKVKSDRESVETAAEQKMAKSVGNIFLLGEALDAAAKHAAAWLDSYACVREGE